MDIRLCNTCGKTLDEAESCRTVPICDICVLKKARARGVDIAKTEKLAAVPIEYRDNNGIVTSMYKMLKTDISVFRRKNIYIGGDKSQIIKMGWALYTELWNNTRAANMISFISWYTKYKSNPPERWDMTVEMAEYDGIVILNIDTLYGVDDQGILYAILQAREDRRNKTCILHNIADGDLMSSMLSSYIKDETSNYLTIKLTKT